MLTARDALINISIVCWPSTSVLKMRAQRLRLAKGRTRSGRASSPLYLTLSIKMKQEKIYILCNQRVPTFPLVYRSKMQHKERIYSAWVALPLSFPVQPRCSASVRSAQRPRRRWNWNHSNPRHRCSWPSQNSSSSFSLSSRRSSRSRWSPEHPRFFLMGSSIRAWPTGSGYPSGRGN